jgi:S-adenosylmethionine hydrolase
MAPIITLLTDFGLRDTYVGQLKGVLLSLCPEARIVDLTHEVAPQDVEEGAFLLESAVDAFPLGTVHLAVVDPGVGSGRKAVAIASRGRFYVGPDNGLLSCALPEDSRPPEPARVTIADGTLARGEDLHTGGPRLESLWALPAFRARERDGAVSGRVIHIDIYGNLVTDILASQWTEGAEAVLVTTSGETALARYRTGRGVIAVPSQCGSVCLAETDGLARQSSPPAFVTILS